MTSARSKIRPIFLLLISIYRPTSLILCVLDVGLAGRVCFISTIPHLPPSTPNLSSDQLITINVRLFYLRFRGGLSLSSLFWTVSGLPRITYQNAYFIPCLRDYNASSINDLYCKMLFLAWGYSCPISLTPEIGVLWRTHPISAGSSRKYFMKNNSHQCYRSVA